MTALRKTLQLVRFGDGSTFEGEWLDGNRHGRGIYTWANGNR